MNVEYLVGGTNVSERPTAWCTLTVEVLYQLAESVTILICVREVPSSNQKAG
jgi:hypothetical protein